MFWSKLIQMIDSVTLMVSLFSPNNASKFITYTLFSFRNDCSIVD
jgi:hypothetical protein